MPIKHVFQNNIADGTDTSIVRPSDWNAAHSIALTQPELTSIIFGAIGAGTAAQFLETTGPSGVVQWATPAGSGGGVSVFGTPLTGEVTGWANAATILALSIGNNLSLIASTLSALSTSGISVAGAPLVNQIAQFNNAATVSPLSIGNNLSLVSGTLAALAAGISVTGAPAAGQVAAWASGNSLLGVTIGTNVSLIGGNTLSASGSGGVSVVPTPTAGQLTAFSNSASIIGVTIGSNVSLIGGNTISATGTGGISVAGTPTAGEITGWNNAATVTSILIGTGLSLTASALSAAFAQPAMVSLASSSPVSTSTVSFVSISSAYSSLYIVGIGRSDGTGQSTSAVTMRFNGDSSLKYAWQIVFSLGASAPGGSQGVSQSAVNIAEVGLASSFLNQPGTFYVTIPGYAQTSFGKGCLGHYQVFNGASISNLFDITVTGNWASVAAVNRVDFILGAGNWATGSKITLYGLL